MAYDNPGDALGAVDAGGSARDARARRQLLGPRRRVGRRAARGAPAQRHGRARVPLRRRVRRGEGRVRARRPFDVPPTQRARRSTSSRGATSTGATASSTRVRSSSSAAASTSSRPRTSASASAASSWGQWHGRRLHWPAFVATPSWAVQWLDNDVVEGNGVVNYWTASDAVSAPTRPRGRSGVDARGAALGAIAARRTRPASRVEREIAADALLVYRRNRVYSTGTRRGRDVRVGRPRRRRAPRGQRRRARRLGEPPGRPVHRGDAGGTVVGARWRVSPW